MKFEIKDAKVFEDFCKKYFPKNMTFEEELQNLINKYTNELSNTPDFIFAAYLTVCLETWKVAVKQQETWYGGNRKNPVETRS